MTSGTLYIVPTPIGNLSDITLRAIEVLNAADYILAEDTRTSGKLLSHYHIATPRKSYHMHNEHRVVTGIIKDLMQGKTIALISDAGTPGISDPGFLLARAGREAGVRVECLPGATALIPALVSSGFPSDRFVFEGFLPPKKGRQTRLNLLKEETRTMIFYESPHKLIKSLEQFAEFFGLERQISISRELTKLFEETVQGTIEHVLQHFKQNPPKGEFVIVLKGRE